MSKLKKKKRDLKTYNLADESGRILGQITFNPKDTEIPQRFSIVANKLDDLMEGFEEKTEEERSKEIEVFIHENLNYLLNADVSGTFFSVLKPYAVLENGKYFFEQILEVVGAIIVKENKGIFKHR